MLSRRAKERISAGIGALAFLLLFGGIGALGMWAVVATIYDGLRAKSWAAVPVTITRVDMGLVTYVYEWNGTAYTGERAGAFALGSASSDVDDWEDRMAAMIDDALAEKIQAKAYVNPRDPAESMLDREIRWKLLAVFMPFAVGFTAAGIVISFMLGRSAFGWKESRAGVPLLKPRAREALLQWVVGIVWTSVCLPLAMVAMPELWSKGEWFPVILLAIFPFVGLLILWSALHSTAAVLREGSPFNARTAS